MIIKKYYGETIKKALKDARHHLGDDVILLESTTPDEERPASVTVMVDKKKRSATPASVSYGYDAPAPEEAESPEQDVPETPATSTYKRSDVRKKVGSPRFPKIGQSSGDQTETDEEADEQQSVSKRRSKKRDSRRGEEETPKEDYSVKKSPTSRGDEDEDPKPKRRKKRVKTDSDTDTDTEEATPAPSQSSGKRKKWSATREEMTETTEDENLPEPKGIDEDYFPRKNKDDSLLNAEIPKSSPNGYFQTSAVNREINALHRRFDQIESMLGEALISANLDYAAHPAFQQLLNSGIRATTISGWFKEILNKGIDPNEQHDTFMFELAKIVRDALTITLPKATEPNLVFVGPSGAGKTSLIMKLATNPDFFEDRNIALVSVQPRQMGPQYTVLEPFANDHDLSFFKVRDGIDVTKLMPKLVDYDHVLFDTPSISLEKKTAFRDYWKIRQILASVMPLEVHFVIDATLENYYFREAYATNHPLQPDYVAITHLDETHRWGQLIPFLKTLGCSVRYMALGSGIPDDVNAFSPTWFAEQILSS